MLRTRVCPGPPPAPSPRVWVGRQGAAAGCLTARSWTRLRMVRGRRREWGGGQRVQHAARAELVQPAQACSRPVQHAHACMGGGAPCMRQPPEGVHPAVRGCRRSVHARTHAHNPPGPHSMRRTRCTPARPHSLSSSPKRTAVSSAEVPSFRSAPASVRRSSWPGCQRRTLLLLLLPGEGSCCPCCCSAGATSSHAALAFRAWQCAGSTPSLVSAACRVRLRVWRADR